MKNILREKITKIIFETMIQPTELSSDVADQILEEVIKEVEGMKIYTAKDYQKTERKTVYDQALQDLIDKLGKD
jgi:hypothetical protein